MTSATRHSVQISPALTFTRHTNRSATLPSDRPPEYSQHGSQPNSFDPAAALSAMRLTDPTTVGVPDPVPRAGSSMSLRTLQNPQHLNSLTIGPSHLSYSHLPAETPDGASLHSGGSRNSQHDSFHDVASVRSYSYDETSNDYSSLESYGLSASQNRAFSPQAWHPHPGDYNPLYAAASNVLGMSPPPPPLPNSPPPRHPTSYYPAPHTAFVHGPASRPLATYTISSGHGSGLTSSTSSLPSNPSTIPASDPREFEPRPPFQRGGTSVSVAPSTNKSKAVDLSAPPFTKEYIEQYRQRIKADPDPEAHFLYAKYLIDAAKHLRSTAQDQRAAKKSSEVLIGESLKVIRRLATQGDAYNEAQFFLANCHGTGALGLQVDHERAYHLYLQAAKQNHAAASYRVAVCNEIGAGTRKEPTRAAAFYRKAASLGDTPAMYKLGMILLNGLIEEQRNPREAINWLKRAAEQADVENPHALHELALLHEIPNSPLVPYDPPYAKSLFTQAAQLGYTPSQYKLGQCYEYGSLTCPVDPRRSIAWYTKAAEKGDPEAELALSGWYLTGSEGVLKQSDSEAYLWARRAANKGLSKAEYAVGYYAEVGIGIKQDIEFAKRWYMRAAGMLLHGPSMIFTLVNVDILQPKETRER